MSLNNIKRNNIDYILTDVLPVELSDLYTHKYFYEYLNQKENYNIITNTIKSLEIIKNKSSANKILFEDGRCWTSIPLKYNIMKSLNSEREMSLLQPLAAFELFVFISLFQSELLTTLENNSIYSLRYHKRNKNLIYKKRKGKLTEYFSDVSDKLSRDVIQQTGIYFDIGPYPSLPKFTNSDLWFTLNSKYKYFIKTDYKTCFDSIYTHTYKWIVGKDVNDTKNFKNVNLFTTIDRVLQNINAKTSNGIVVGPEFSRMMAEILLQSIDKKVNNELINNSFIHDEDYSIYRYVDDLFIFTNSEELADKIYSLYCKEARHYMLQLNESKLLKIKLPFILNSWYKDANELANQFSNILFYTKEEIASFISKQQLQREKTSINITSNGDKNGELLNEDDSDEPGHLLKSQVFIQLKATLKTKYNILTCSYPEREKTIVSYFLGVVSRKIMEKGKDSLLFRKNVNGNVVFEFLDFIFFIYSYYPDYNNTQKLISIISFINDEYSLNFNDSVIFQKIIEKYSFILDRANLNDVINLILLCVQMKVEIPYKQEIAIVKRLKKENNPILWASYLIYSKYNNTYFKEILNETEKNIEFNMDAIISVEEILTYNEFWWLLVFNKCPHINPQIQARFNNILNHCIVNQ